MKLPPNVYLGEGIGMTATRRALCSCSTAAPSRRRRSSWIKKGNYVREIGKEFYGHVFCHGVRVDAQDNIWVIDEGSNWKFVRFNPEGRVTS